MNIDAIIFDFNGTLLWDTALHNSAWDAFLLSYNIALTVKQKDEVIHGKTNREIFQTLFDREIKDDELKVLSEEKEQIYRNLVVASGIELAEGAEEFFGYCIERGIRIAIATSSYKENMAFFIRHFNLDRWFKTENMVYNDGIMKGKPDPEIFYVAIERLNVRQERVAIFEDSLAGILAAEAANVGKIYVVNSGGNSPMFSNYLQVDSFKGFKLDEA